MMLQIKVLFIIYAMNESKIQLESFGEESQQQRIQQIIDKLQIRNTTIWNIMQYKGKSHIDDFLEVMKHIKKSQVQQINIKYNKVQDIFQYNIPFNSLLILTLQNCHILNIEFLIKLSAHSLIDLNLNNNHINRTKSLRKCHFPYLQSLRLQNNPIFEANGLEQSFNQAEIFTLQLQDFESAHVMEDLNFLFKMKHKLSKIYCEGQQRIKKEIFWSMLRRTKTEEEMGMKIYKFKLYGAM